MIGSKRQKRYIRMRGLILLFLILSSLITMACIFCDTGLFPIEHGDEGGEFTEIDVTAEPASPVVSFVIMIVMALSLITVFYIISRGARKAKE